MVLSTLNSSGGRSSAFQPWCISCPYVVAVFIRQRIISNTRPMSVLSQTSRNCTCNNPYLLPLSHLSTLCSLELVVPLRVDSCVVGGIWIKFCTVTVQSCISTALPCRFSSALCQAGCRYSALTAISQTGRRRRTHARMLFDSWEQSRPAQITWRYPPPATVLPWLSQSRTGRSRHHNRSHGMNRSPAYPRHDLDRTPETDPYTA